MRRFLLVLGCLMAAPPAAAEDAAAVYEQCLARAIGAFETRLARSRAAPAGPNFEVVSNDAVRHCGALAGATCDRGAGTAVCQTGLAERHHARRAAVLASAPAPAAVRGLDPLWSDGLYPQLWAITRSPSAGPDCEGADAAYAAWCAMHQASLRLADAVMLWQVARVLGAAAPAVEEGWVDAPPPPQPVARP